MRSAEELKALVVHSLCKTKSVNRIFDFLGWHKLMKLRQVVYELTMLLNPHMHSRLLARTYQLLAHATCNFMS